MAALTLVIANKSYSSWSLRPWLLMRRLGINFNEIVIPLYEDGYETRILKHSPTGKVPCLIDGETTVWESLAIVDYLADRFPDRPVWPEAPGARAYARSICAEMHAGFGALRAEFTMNIRRKIPGRTPSEATRADVARIEAIWREARERFGGGGPVPVRRLFGRGRHVRAGGDALRNLRRPDRAGVLGLCRDHPVDAGISRVARSRARGALGDRCVRAGLSAPLLSQP